MTRARLDAADALFDQAIAEHGNGDLAKAEPLYRRALASNPDHAQAANNLAVLLVQQNRLDEAHEAFRRAAASASADMDGLLNYGRFLLRRLHQPAEAVVVLRRAAALEPENPALPILLGQALVDCGAGAEAVELLRRAVVLEPAAPLPRSLLGKALFLAGQWSEAERMFSALLETHPADWLALTFLGLCHYQMKDLAAAIDCFDRALVLKPDDVDALINRGIALMDSGRLEEARDGFVAAMAQGGDPAAALANLGVVAHRLKDIGGAIFAYRAAERLNPDLPRLYSNLSTVLVEAAEPAAALAAADQAVQRDPADAAAQFNRAVSLLKLGRLREGWQAYEGRGRLPDAPLLLKPSGLRGWRGLDDRVAPLLVRAEQGLGDTVQFCRYAVALAEMGWEVVLEVQTPLVRLLRGLSDRITVVRQGGVAPPCQAEAPLLSLPYLLGAQVPEIPAMPVLRPTSTDESYWWALLGPARGRLRVGLAWSGSADASYDQRRSLSAGDLAPLLEVAEVEFVGLQLDSPADDRIRSLAGFLSDFADTAALIDQLDLVISVDTAVAHLAAAMGKPVWLLSRHDGCWRWLTGREDSPWYPSLRLFRQTRRGDWGSVVARVAAALRARVTGVPEQLPPPEPPEAPAVEAMTGRVFDAAVHLHQSGRLAAAEVLYRAIVEQAPGQSSACLNLAETLLQRGLFEQAEATLRRLVKTRPDHANGWLNLGVAWQETRGLAAAGKAYRRALRLDAALVQAHGNLAKVELQCNHVDAAVRSAREAVRLQPDNADLHFTLALALLTQGDYLAGWREYEWRWRLPNMLCPWTIPDVPRWTGESLAGRHLLVVAEQGFGDTIQFSRFLRELRPAAASVTLLVLEPLRRLMAASELADRVICDPAEMGAIDVQVPLMSIPHLLGVSFDRVPAEMPYLSVPDELVAAWRLERPADRLAVGLVWAGSTGATDRDAQRMDRKRSIPPELMAPLTSVEGVCFYSLQKGNAPVMPGVTDAVAAARDFLDTAAIIRNLDLVITVDTAVAHLAGALRVPVWVASRYDACWRWPRQQPATPWYPTARVFHQSRFGAWTDVLVRLRQALSTLTERRP